MHQAVLILAQILLLQSLVITSYSIHYTKLYEFETFVGALRGEESKAYLRPETAQGIFANWSNVLDTQRVKLPFGIAQGFGT